MSPEALTSTSLVLVAILKSPRELEIARLLGWYRIPLRSAPKIIAVDYLAFYQTSAFGGDEGGCIRYAAPVLGHELATRAELLRDEPDHPHAQREYYKVQLGPLSPLPHPVRAQGWRRLTFLYTTGENLLNAHTLNDLVLQHDQRRSMWRALYDRLENSQAYQAGRPPGVDLPDEVLAALLGYNSR